MFLALQHVDIEDVELEMSEYQLNGISQHNVILYKQNNEVHSCTQIWL